MAMTVIEEVELYFSLQRGPIFSDGPDPSDDCAF